MGFEASTTASRIGSGREKKGGPRAAFRSVSLWRSALRELEAAASFLLAVLLALDDAGVAGQEAFLLEGAAQIRLIMRQRLGEAVAYCAGLAREAAAIDVDDDVVL